MALAEQLTDDMKAALKAGDRFRLATLRMALAAVRQAEVDTRKAQSDADVIAILEKLIKRGRDAESQFRDAGRTEQADKEAGEIAIFAEYLPTRLTDAELDDLISRTVEATGASSMRDMGKVMGELKRAAAGRIDMAAANKRVQELLRQT